MLVGNKVKNILFIDIGYFRVDSFEKNKLTTKVFDFFEF